MRRFHNNNITIVNLTHGRESDDHGADFVVRQGESAHQLGVGKVNDVTLDFADGDLFIERRNPDAVGMILNTGIRQVSLEYWLLGNQKQVGPSTDTIPMGTYREMGMGPGVQWRVKTWRGEPKTQSDKAHQAARK